MIAEVKVSGKYQIVIPQKVRNVLGIESGDHLIVDMENKDIILHPKPKSYTHYMQGLGKEIWRNINVDKYLDKERKSWERKR